MYCERADGQPQSSPGSGANQAATATQSGGNRRARRSASASRSSVLWATITTDTSCGAVNTAHDSLTPLAGGMAMLNIALGEMVFGGVGVGIMGLLVFAILAVFIAGLMVGRTPEYLGKKIEGREMKLAMLAVLVLLRHGPRLRGHRRRAARPARTPSSTTGRTASPRSCTRTLSQTGNNGSAFAGITVERHVLGHDRRPIAMMWGRFFFIIPCLALAARWRRRSRVPPSSGTFPTTGGIFVVLLVGVILIVGALTYFPALRARARSSSSCS